MRKAVGIAFVLMCTELYAGGAIGGNPGLALEQMISIRPDVGLIDSLKKEYVSPEVYKRTLMRLSPAGVETTPMLLRGQYIDVTKVEDRVVDTSVTSEILSE
jgi:hypothetical protein